MEDFGYSKEREENYASSLVKRAFLVGASLFSLACFGYITVSAYYFFSQNGGEIKTIEAPADPIKIVENEASGEQSSMKIDSSIYEDIFGTRKRTKDIKLRETVEPALPPKQEIIEKKPEEKNIAKASDEKPASHSQSTQTPLVSTPKKIIVYSQDEIKGNDNLLPNSNKVEKKPEVAVQKPTSNKKYIRVQIAALTSKQGAHQYLEKLKQQHSSLFSGLEDYIQEIDLGKRGIFYRVQIGNFYDQVRAENFCKKYTTQAQKSRADCIIVE